jgi:hypothetical protein
MPQQEQALQNRVRTAGNELQYLTEKFKGEMDALSHKVE